MSDTLPIADGSSKLALKLDSITNNLSCLAYNLAGFEFSFDLRAIASDCEALRVAWNTIEIWTRPSRPSDGRTTQLCEKLEQSLSFERVTLEALEEDLDPLLKLVNNSSIQSQSFRRRSTQMWDGARFEKHQHRIRGQVVTMTLLLQVINLQATTERTQLSENDEERGTVDDPELRQGNDTPKSASQQYTHHIGEDPWDKTPELRLQDPLSDLQLSETTPI